MKTEDLKYLLYGILIHTWLMHAGQVQPKILHITFHQGLANEIKAVSKIFDFDLTTWIIPELPDKFWDGVLSRTNRFYNVDHELAKRIWQKHKALFNSFDAIITSDTAPLSRIFLQNNFTKPLIIWICNRFDYSDGETANQLHFPDAEYYQLFKDSRQKVNVRIISYTPFEHVYAGWKNIDCGNFVIKPIGDLKSLKNLSETTSTIPKNINKKDTFFIPHYNNDRAFNLQNICESRSIKAYCGRYDGPTDLIGFKGIIHLPYAWSNLALWENVQNGLVYFIPSFNFIQTLITSSPHKYFFSNFRKNTGLYSEWYDPENRPLFVYFDSWDDLKYKILNTDFAKKKEEILLFTKNHTKIMLNRWQSLFIDLKLINSDAL